MEDPIDVHGLGVYYRNLFADGRDRFDELTKAHTFQTLTESNKPGTSYRKGIYLSNVVESGDGVHFNLLRCSTNLKGPTESFTKVDMEIVDRVQSVAKTHYKDSAPLNHVLAQVYENSTVTDGVHKKEKKAKIKSHSDKTKDMPDNGLIAFVTFYSKEVDDPQIKQSQEDPYDRVYKNGSVLTTLHFKSKEEDAKVKEFSITLYPNSAFIIPLETNRLYTHEIVPPQMSVDKIPTRLGYVIRCSKTEATHVDGVTCIKKKDGLTPLKSPTDEQFDWLKQKYYEENLSTDKIEYGDVDFTLNDGDLLAPIVVSTENA